MKMCCSPCLECKHVARGKFNNLMCAFCFLRSHWHLLQNSPSTYKKPEVLIVIPPLSAQWGWRAAKVPRASGAVVHFNWYIAILPFKYNPKIPSLNCCFTIWCSVPGSVLCRQSTLLWIWIHLQQLLLVLQKVLTVGLCRIHTGIPMSSLPQQLSWQVICYQSCYSHIKKFYCL